MYLNKIKLSNFLFCLALFLSFFPHTTFGIFNLKGSQISLIFPLFFFIFLFFSINRLKLNIFILSVIMISFFAFMINFFVTDQYYLTLIIRTAANYFFFIILFICFNTYYYPNEENIRKIILSANFIWLIWGALQALGITSENFAFTNRIVGTNIVSSRGLNSLATEPFYFGMILILFNSFYLFKSNFKSFNLSITESRLLILNFLTIFFIVKAATTSLMSLPIILVFFLKNHNFLSKKYIIVLLSILFIFFSAIYFFQIDKTTNRGLGYFFTFLDPEQVKYLFLSDWSFNSRFENMVSPLIGLHLNNGMPGGFNGYLNLRDEIGIIFYNLTNLNFVSKIDLNNINEMKISGFLGDFIYQQGIFGILIILLFVIKIFNNNSYFDSIIFLFMFFIITINPQMTFTFIPLLLFIAIYDKQNSQIKN